MRLGISATCLLPGRDGKIKIDGIGTYTANLIKAFEDNHINLTPCYFANLQQHYFARKHLNTAITLQWPNYFSLFLPRSLALHSSLENKLDVFHCTDYRIPRFKKVPVIATLHDAIMFKHPEWANQKLRTIKNYLLKKTARWANHIIAVSHAMMEDLVNYWGVKEEQISVVYPGVSSDWFEPVTKELLDAVLNKYQLPANFLLTVGTLQPRKNIQRIIAAYELLPAELQQQHQLVIIGKEGWESADTVAKINQLQQRKLATWLQYVPYQDLKVLYRAAKILLFPSLSEGFGLPILEGFAAEVPVLTSNITSMPEVAGDGACLVNPYEIDSIFEGMMSLLTNQSMVEQLVAKASDRVKEFSWDRCAKETMALYQALTK